MKLAFLTDLHIMEDSSNPGSALEHQVEGVARFLKDLDQFRVQLTVIGGDLCGLRVPHRASPAERNLIAVLCLEAAKRGPVIVCRGNHDFDGDYWFLSHLGGRHPIHFVADDCTVIEVDDPDGEGTLYVAVMPWLFPPSAMGHEEHTEYVNEEARKLADKVRKFKKKAPRSKAVFVGHAAVAGASIRAGQPAVATKDPTLRIDGLFDDGTFDLALFGHYHMPQKLADVDDGFCPIHYGGSMFVNEYGEPCSKRWLCWDSKKSEILSVEIPQRPKVIVEVDPAENTVLVRGAPQDLSWPETIEDLEQVDFSGCDVRMKVHAPAAGLGPLESAVRTARAALGTADSVRVQEVHPETAKTRDGAEEVAKGASIVEKVAAYFEAAMPGESKRAVSRALSILGEIEAGMASGVEGG